MVLPNVVIVGAPRCGTSSLFTWLTAHPAVCGSTVKETQFLMDRDSSLFNPRCNVHTHGLQGYEQYFSPCATTSPSLVLEATPGYFYQRTALDVLATLPSAPTLLFVLRQPAERVYSMFRYLTQNWGRLPAKVSFVDYLAMLKRRAPEIQGNEFLCNALCHSQYVDYLTLWRQRCGAERLQVMMFEELQPQPQAFMQGLATRLHIDPDFYKTYDFPQKNVSYQVKHYGLHQLNVRLRRWLPSGWLRQLLRRSYRRLNVVSEKSQKHASGDLQAVADLKEYFRPYNVRLAQEFGLNLTAWE